MVVTDEVFQVCNGWLKEVHPQNMNTMSVTDEVFQLDNGWLKEVHS